MNSLTLDQKFEILETNHRDIFVLARKSCMLLQARYAYQREFFEHDSAVEQAKKTGSFTPSDAESLIFDRFLGGYRLDEIGKAVERDAVASFTLSTIVNAIGTDWLADFNAGDDYQAAIEDIVISAAWDCFNPSESFAELDCALFA